MANQLAALDLHRDHGPATHLPQAFPSIFHAAVDALGEDPRGRLRAFLAERYLADEVVLVDSGTHALELAIRTAHAAIANRSSGSVPPLTVALPAYSCYDLATAVIGANAQVELYDVNPQTLGPETRSFEAALGAGATVAVVAPLYGVPVDWDACSAVAARFGAVLIEDAAQGQGASWRGVPLGGVGGLSVLSFGRGKGWTGRSLRRWFSKGDNIAIPPMRHQSVATRQLQAFGETEKVECATGSYSVSRDDARQLRSALHYSAGFGHEPVFLLRYCHSGNEIGTKEQGSL